MNTKKVAKYVGLVVVSLFFLGGGVGHFIQPEFFIAIVPPYLPYHLALVYISGVFELALGVLIWFPRFRSLAGWGLVALTIAVTPANIHMWLHPELFPDVEPSFLSIRLVIQVFLLALIWWSTRPMDNGHSSIPATQ